MCHRIKQRVYRKGNFNVRKICYPIDRNESYIRLTTKEYCRLN